MRKYAKNCILILLSIFLLASCLLSGCSLFQNSGTSAAPIRINEVVSSNGGSYFDSDFGKTDWVEIYNGSEQTVDLLGYELSNGKTNFVFPSHTVDPDGFALVLCMPTPADSRGKLVSGFNLSKSGTNLIFKNPQGGTIEVVSIPELERDISYGIDNANEWVFFLKPTPLAQNSGDYADDISKLTSVSNTTGIEITEVMPSNTRSLPAPDGKFYGWCELFNSTDSDINLANYWISDSIAKSTKSRLPEIVLSAGHYAVVYFGAEINGQICASFKLSNTDRGVYLFDRYANIVSSLTWNAAIPSDISYGRTGEGYGYFRVSTPGEQNPGEVIESFEYSQMPTSAPVHINEFMLKDADGNPGFIELKNFTGSPVDLTGYYISDNPNNPEKFSLAGNIVNDFLVITTSGLPEQGALNTPFKLGSTDTAIMLTNGLDLTTEEIEVPLMKKGVSYGKTDSGWGYFASPTPGSVNSTPATPEIPSKTSSGGTSTVLINEVLSSGDPKGDWFELYNRGNSAVNLAGWTMSDSKKTPGEMPLSGSIGAGEYRQFYTSYGFNIGSSGEVLYLFMPDEELGDSFETGVLAKGISSGRLPNDPATRAFFTTPTPGAPNNSATLGNIVSAPEFFPKGGIVSGQQNVKLTTATPGAKIYYTTDGSMPTSSSKEYSETIAVTKNTAIRAIAIKSGMRNSLDKCSTYLFEEPHKIPVVCMTMSPDELRTVDSSRERADGKQARGMVEFYELNGMGTSFPARVQLVGKGTRGAAKKSYSLALRATYGLSHVNYPFFLNSDFTKFSGLILRASGQDRSRARLRDAYTGEALRGMDVDYQDCRFVALYINGKYNGLYDLKEDLNASFLETKFGVNRDDTEIIRHNLVVLRGSRDAIKAARIEALTKNLSDPVIWEDYNKRVDTDSMIDYLIARTFMNDTDCYNQKYWRSTDYKVRWRTIIFDSDMIYPNYRGFILPSYFNPGGIPSPNDVSNMDFYVGMKRNAPQWYEKLAARYAWAIKNVFPAERQLLLFDGMVAEMETEMPREIKRWGGYNSPKSMADWKAEIAKLRTCVKERPAVAWGLIKNYFKKSDSELEGLISKYEFGTLPPLKWEWGKGN